MYNITYLAIASSEPENCQYNIKQGSLSVNIPYTYFAYCNHVILFLLVAPITYLKLI
jgi:hypothetical protein